MLTKYRKALAKEIAIELIRDGILLGEELEEHIRVGLAADINFKNNLEYMEFEDSVLDYIDMLANKVIEIIDTKTNESNKFLKVPSASKKTGLPETTIHNAIYKNSLIKNRYRARYCKLTIKELLVGVS